MFSPFEQFQLYPYFYIFSKTAIFLLLALGVYLFFFVTIFNIKPSEMNNSWQLGKFLPRRSYLQYLFEFIYDFLYQLVKTYIGEAGFLYFPVIASFFLWILALNFLGMVPYAFTVTSHIATTGGFALAIFIGIQIIGILVHRFYLFQFFLPAGAPMWLVPFIPLIELMSYVFRVFSLAIRLIANMTSGHLLIHIFAGFAWNMINGVLLILFPVVFSLVIALNGLELGIAFLQAYVFSILVSIYLSDVVNCQHD